MIFFFAIRISQSLSYLTSDVNAGTHFLFTWVKTNMPDHCGYSIIQELNTTGWMWDMNPQP